MKCCMRICSLRRHPEWQKEYLSVAVFVYDEHKEKQKTEQKQKKKREGRIPLLLQYTVFHLCT